MAILAEITTRVLSAAEFSMYLPYTKYENSKGTKGPKSSLRFHFHFQSKLLHLLAIGVGQARTFGIGDFQKKR